MKNIKLTFSLMISTLVGPTLFALGEASGAIALTSYERGQDPLMGKNMAHFINHRELDKEIDRKKERIEEIKNKIAGEVDLSKSFLQHFPEENYYRHKLIPQIQAQRDLLLEGKLNQFLSNLEESPFKKEIQKIFEGPNSRKAYEKQAELIKQLNTKEKSFEKMADQFSISFSLNALGAHITTMKNKIEHDFIKDINLLGASVVNPGRAQFTSSGCSALLPDQLKDSCFYISKIKFYLKNYDIENKKELSQKLAKYEELYSQGASLFNERAEANQEIKQLKKEISDLKAKQQIGSATVEKGYKEYISDKLRNGEKASLVKVKEQNFFKRFIDNKITSAKENVMGAYHSMIEKLQKVQAQRKECVEEKKLTQEVTKKFDHAWSVNVDPTVRRKEITQIAYDAANAKAKREAYELRKAEQIKKPLPPTPVKVVPSQPKGTSPRAKSIGTPNGFDFTQTPTWLGPAPKAPSRN